MTKKHKRILFLSTLALPVALVPATMVSCSKKDIEEIENNETEELAEEIENTEESIENIIEEDNNEEEVNIAISESSS